MENTLNYQFNYPAPSALAAVKLDPNAPIYASEDGRVASLSSQECIFLVKRTGEPHVMTFQVLQALDLCREFRTLDEHVARIQSTIPGLADKGEPVRLVVYGHDRTSFLVSRHQEEDAALREDIAHNARHHRDSDITGVIESRVTPHATGQLLAPVEAECQSSNGRPEDIMKGQGGSVVNVLSVGLRMFALTTLDSASHRRFLVLDEQDCWLRPDLVPRLVRIVHEAGKALGKIGAPVASASFAGPSGNRAGWPKNSVVSRPPVKSRSPTTATISLRRNARMHSRAARPNGMGLICRRVR
jgi:hypothetical protein